MVPGPNPTATAETMRLDQKWECLVCGYGYDPAVGDATQGIPPGTRFEDLPEDWTCPDCGATKDLFEPVE
jgi:rubredoxin